MQERRNIRMTERLAQLALVALSLLIVLAVAELAFRSFWPLADPHRYWRLGNDFIRSQHSAYFTRRLKAEPGLPGVRGTSRYTTNNMGFRGSDIAAQKPSTEYRIFLIGGSSMECYVLDDEDSIDAVLENHLTGVRGGSVRVYNAGKSGDLTDDHLAIFSQRIVHLEPDLIVVFAGINDLRGVAEDFEVPLYDVAGMLPKASTHFYDDVHFNVRGAREAALGLSTIIIEQGWLTE